MKYQFLTLTSCFQGIFLNGVESLFKPPYREPRIPQKYQLVRWIKRQGGDNTASVGLFTDANGKRFIIKHLQYRWKNLTYRQMLNEASLLSLFSDWSYLAKSGRRIAFPVLCDVIHRSNELVIVKEFEEGETLETSTVENQKAVVMDCLEALRSINQDKLSAVGKREDWHIAISFPLYWLRAVLKSPAYVGLLVRLLIVFFRYSTFVTKDRLVVTHRDLYQKNILVNDHGVFILDLESMVLCTRETELALVARFNNAQWGRASVHQMLVNLLDTNETKKSFSALSIYYAVQMMVTDRSAGPYYKESLNFLVQYEAFLTSLVT